LGKATGKRHGRREGRARMRRVELHVATALAAVCPTAVSPCSCPASGQHGSSTHKRHSRRSESWLHQSAKPGPGLARSLIPESRLCALGRGVILYQHIFAHTIHAPGRSTYSSLVCSTTQCWSLCKQVWFVHSSQPTVRPVRPAKAGLSSLLGSSGQWEFSRGLVIEVGCFDGADEELRPVGILPTVGHGEDSQSHLLKQNSRL